MVSINFCFGHLKGFCLLHLSCKPAQHLDEQFVIGSQVFLFIAKNEIFILLGVMYMFIFDRLEMDGLRKLFICNEL